MAGVGALGAARSTVTPQFGELSCRQTSSFREVFSVDEPSCVVPPRVGKGEIVLLKANGLLGVPQDVSIPNKKFASPVNLCMLLPKSSPEGQLVNEFFDTDNGPDLGPVLWAAVSLDPDGSTLVPRHIAGPFATLQLLKDFSLKCSLLGNGFAGRGAGELQNNTYTGGSGIRGSDFQSCIGQLCRLEDGLGLLNSFVPSTVFPPPDGHLQFLIDIAFTCGSQTTVARRGGRTGWCRGSRRSSELLDFFL